jgi:hypothetical protein
MDRDGIIIRLNFVPMSAVRQRPLAHRFEPMARASKTGKGVIPEPSFDFSASDLSHACGRGRPADDILQHTAQSIETLVRLGNTIGVRAARPRWAATRRLVPQNGMASLKSSLRSASIYPGALIVGDSRQLRGNVRTGAVGRLIRLLGRTDDRAPAKDLGPQASSVLI